MTLCHHLKSGNKGQGKPKIDGGKNRHATLNIHP